MPRITTRRSYDGFENKVDRLGLSDLLEEVEESVTWFDLLIEESRHANGTKWIREQVDSRFESMVGWQKVTSGGVDWTKSNKEGCSLGVEVQVSGRSDLLAVDVLHLQEELTIGNLDVGVIVVPDDTLSPFLTDRTPNLRTAIRHVEPRAQDLPVQILAFRHDGTGKRLSKAITNLGHGESS